MRRGMSLASVLLMISLAAVVAFTLAGLSTSYLARAQRYAASVDALALAEAAAATTVSNIKANNRFGLANEEVRIQPDDDATRFGRVVFDPSADAWSTNNYKGLSAVDAWGGTVVPGGTVHIVATGSSRGATATVEVMLGVPQFPYVIAVAGTLQSTGGLLVSGPQISQSAPPATASVGEASVASNDSIRCASRADVTGDVVAPGDISLTPDSVVGGQVRNDTVDLPEIDLSQFDPTSRASATRVNDSPGGSLRVDGVGYTSADLTVGGDLTMNGLLYVKGRLTVNGALRGKGGVVVRGPATVRGGIDLRGASPLSLTSAAASNMIALLADGDVALEAASTSSYFEGLVYTHGNFSARNITVLGTFVASPAGGVGTGRMDLDNVRVYKVHQAAELRVTLGDTAAVDAASQLLAADARSIALAQDSKSGDPAVVVPANAAQGPWTQIPVTYPYVGVPQTVETQPERTAIINGMRARLRTTPYSFQGDLTTSAHVGNVQLDLTQRPGEFLVISVPSTLRVDSSGRFYVAASNNLEVVATVVHQSDRGRNISREQAGVLAAQEGISLDEMIQASIEAQREAAYQANLTIDGKRDRGELPAVPDSWDFSLNRFLADKAPMRVLSWRQR